MLDYKTLKYKYLYSGYNSLSTAELLELVDQGEASVANMAKIDIISRLEALEKENIALKMRAAPSDVGISIQELPDDARNKLISGLLKLGFITGSDGVGLTLPSGGPHVK
jgi:hypothetical protein